MKRPYQFKAQCLVCDHKGTVSHNSKEEYQAVTVCPKCNGAFVDVWNFAKYKSKCSNLSTQQIKMIREMLKRNKKGMDICSCDIQRVLELEGNN